MSARPRRRPWILGPVLAVLVPWACGGPQELAGQNETCYRDDDCEAGLVCVAPAGTEDRRCTNDVTGLVSMVPGAPPPMMETGGAAQAGAPATGSGGAPGAAGTPSPPMGGSPTMPDAGVGGA